MALVSVHSIILIARSASGSNGYKYCKPTLLSEAASLIVFQTIPSYFSHWPLPWGLYGVVLLTIAPCYYSNRRSRSDMNEAYLTEWIYVGSPKTAIKALCWVIAVFKNMVSNMHSVQPFLIHGADLVIIFGLVDWVMDSGVLDRFLCCFYLLCIK